MNISFEYYRVFYTVANYGNITKASEVLNISQPAISKCIKNLETQLGGQLFVRTKRGVVLTEEGEAFYSYIKQAMEYINNAENKFSDMIHLETGCIRIGISTTLTKQFLLPFLQEFHQRYPKIDIQIITNYSVDLFPMLRNGLLDLIILNLSGHSYGKDIELIPCREVHDTFVVNQDYRFLLDQKLSLKDLVHYPLVLQSRGSNTREFLDDFTREHGVYLQPNIELASYSLVVEFAKIGLGIGYATKEYLQEEFQKKELFPLPLEEEIPGRFIGIALCKNQVPSFCTKKLIEIITHKT